ncbi:conserved hypothetical protein [Vibrio phage 199E37-1]|nr:conserved hypothetical protein [Vibrio phage 199E37-1]
MAAIIEKKKKYKITKGLFTVKYDTAKELGTAAADIWHRHGELICNPYDPDHIEYGQFSEAYRLRIRQLHGK